MTSSTEQNKAIVRRFVTEVLAVGHVDLVDDLLAATYVNRGMGGMGRADFKAMYPTLGAAIPDRRVEIENLVAEGDMVVARFTYPMTLATGEKITARGLIYYALADGKIVEDDPITTPDLMQMIGAQLAPPSR